MKAITGMSWEEGRPCSTLMFFFVCSTGASAGGVVASSNDNAAAIGFIERSS